MNFSQAARIKRIVEDNFRQPGRAPYRRVYAYWVPMVLFDYTQESYRKLGIKTQMRFRGPRNNPADKRRLSARNQDCLKKFATHFTVYKRDTYKPWS